MRLRNFIYLDSAKLKSYSSQIFEGVTDYILRTDSNEHHESESQKGPLSSGRVLGDIYKNTSNNTKLMFLEDHAYSIFEKHLQDNDYIHTI